MERQQRSRRVILVPSPFQGHISPMLQLGAILYSKGLSITVVHTQYNSPDASSHPHLQFISIPDNLSDDEISSPDKTTLVLILNQKCEIPFRECLTQLVQDQATPCEIACVIYDEMSYFCEPAAHNLQLPSVIFRTSNVITFLVRGTMLRLRAEGCIPFSDPMSEVLAQEHPPLRIKDMPFSYFAPFEVFFEMINNVRNVRRSLAIIYNTMNCIEESSITELQQKIQIPIFGIGPIHKVVPTSSSSLLEEDADCMQWLDKQTPNSVIYISLGSMASTNEKEIAEMAWGLANSKQPFLWVIRPGSIQGSECIEALPEGLKEEVEDRGCIVKWAPQKEVLAHKAVGGFLSHCGWNSTIESICEGVPMLCRPYFGDQKVTARYVSHVWKVGLQLENELDRKELEKSVRMLMTDKEGEEIRERAMKLKVEAQLCIKEGGSSYRSLKELVEFIKSF